MRVKLIINPISGTRSKRGLNQVIERRVRNYGHQIDTDFTSGPGDATRLARKAVDDGYDVVLACGGDGTVNEVARGLINTPVALCILPNGSGNGLARHIELPPDPLLALKVLKVGHIKNCDYCTVNDRPFFCTFGIGFDAAVSQRFAQSRKRGLLTYLKSAIDEFIKFNPENYNIIAGDNSFNVDAFLIACCNASQYGNNAFIAPAASITDGVMDITLIHKGNPISQMLVGVDLLAGSIAEGGLIDTFRSSSVSIQRHAPGVAHVDGEPIELPARLDIKCHHGGLRIVCPNKRYRFKPFITPTRLFIRDCGIAISNLFNKK